MVIAYIPIYITDLHYKGTVHKRRPLERGSRGQCGQRNGRGSAVVQANCTNRFLNVGRNVTIQALDIAMI